jgi:hypothetical protein
VQGVVTGTITDPASEVIPGAAITLTNQGTGVVQHEVSGSNGVYRFSLVPPGGYTLDVKATGFIEKKTTGIVVDASQTASVNVTLSIGTTTSTVEVTESDLLVQTQNADLATTVNLRTIENTPLITRNIFDLAFLAPAVTQGMNGNYASGGARESGTAFLLNGADNNNNFNEGLYNLQPPLESVAEFTVLTNSMSAQYGRASGAVVSAVQKSGTNQFHGVAYEFNRNRAFSANDFFSNRNGQSKPQYNRNQLGGEIDGPVFKNKTFFAFAYDQVTLHTGSNLSQYVFTPAELAATKQGASPIAASLLSKYNPITSNTLCADQATTAPASIGHLGCFNTFDPFLSPEKNYYGRIDQNFSASDRLSVSLNFTRNSQTDQYNGGFAQVGGIPTVNTYNNHNLSLVETHIFSASLVNEATVAHNRHLSNSVEGNGTSASPEIIIDASNYGSNQIGFGPYEGGLVSSFTQDRWQVQDNLSWTKGKHSFKIGGSWQYGILYRNWDLGLPGYYEFGNTTGPLPQNAINGDGGKGVLNPDGSIGNVNDSNDSNFQHDFPYAQEIAINTHTGKQANAYRHYASKDANLFFNDEWKVSRRLTLNLGLRWERYGAPYEIHGILSTFTDKTLPCLSQTCIANAVVTPAPAFWVTRNRDFAPRIGIAYDVFGTGRTAVRAGYGISYDRIVDNVWSNGAWNPPFYGLVDFDATAGDNITYANPIAVGTSYVPDSLPGARGRVSVRTVEYNLKDASVQNMFLGVEQQLRQNLLLRISYQGSLGRHLAQLKNLNRDDGIRYNKTLALLRPNPLYTGFNYRSQDVTSSYNSLITELQKRFSAGLQFQFSYTWSKLMDYDSDLFTGETRNGSYSNPYYFVSNRNRQGEHAAGSFDHTHAFKLNFIYEIPFMRDQKGFVGKALGGWQLSTFYQGYSGHPLEVFSSRAAKKGDALDPNGNPENIGGDYNLDGLANDHPNFTGSSFGSVYSGFSPADGIFTDNNPIGCGSPGQKTSAAAIAACNKSNGVVTANKLFVNPSGYGPVYGNLGRNTFRGPWFNGLNSSLSKSFRLTEHNRLQIRGEAINFLNHPNFDAIDTNLNHTTFGRAQLLVGDAIARQFQLGARLVF